MSVGPPVEATAQEAAGGITTGDKKKTAQTAVCRDRNAELARCCLFTVVMQYMKSSMLGMCKKTKIILESSL